MYTFVLDGQDAAANVATSVTSTAVIFDTTAPVISEVTSVTTPTTDNTPNYTFTTNEAGTISYGGDCSSVTTSATSGSNTITFSTLADGAHSNCTITVTDTATNVSNTLSITAFTVTPASWYNSSWAYRTRISIDHTKIPNTDQSYFPVLISRTDPNWKTTANGGHVGQSDG